MTPPPDKWVSKALAVEVERIGHEVGTFRAHGEIMCQMLKSGDYKVVAKAGLHISNGLAKKGIVLSTAYIYAAHKAADTWADSVWDSLERQSCPVAILKVLAYQQLATVRDVVAGVSDGSLTWAKWTEKQQRGSTKPHRTKMHKNGDDTPTAHVVPVPVYGDEDATFDALVSLMSQWGPVKFAGYYDRAAKHLAKSGTKWPEIK